MTIASEISRLQCAKADICTAIENKGVTVGNITLDNYAPCIDAIQTGGGGTPTFELLVVGGGGSGGLGGCRGGGGGGGGAVVYCPRYTMEGNSLYVNIGDGGVYLGCRLCYTTAGTDGYNTNFGSVSALGGGGGGGCYCSTALNGGAGRDGGNGGGSSGGTCTYPWGCGLQGFDGGMSWCCIITCMGPIQYGVGRGGAGGGGAGGPGGNTPTGCNAYTMGGHGGGAFVSDITGTKQCYGAGGGGGVATACEGYIGIGGPGGGCGMFCGRCVNCKNMANAKGYGGGGGGGYSYCSGDGHKGIVVIRYKTGDFNYEGGCKYVCGDYTIHCITESTSFGNISGFKIVDFLLVGGGGGGGGGVVNVRGGGGGGGGLVIEAPNYALSTGTHCVCIGAGGVGTCTIEGQVNGNGGDSCFDGFIAYGGGAGGLGGNPGTAGCSGGNGGGGGASGTTTKLCGGTGCGHSMCGENGGASYCCHGGGGAGGGIGTQHLYGCSFNGSIDAYSNTGGCGAPGIRSCIEGEYKWYGGGGSGSACATSGSEPYCGGGGWGARYNGSVSCDATYYGGGGGGYLTNAAGACVTPGGNGCQGVFIISYPAACGYSITGGDCCYECNGNCIHIFTQDGTLTVS